MTFDQLLEVGPEESVSSFEQLKTPPAAPTIAHLQQELTKLQTLRAIGVPAEALAEVPFKVLQLLKRRATRKMRGEMRAHPASIRYALLACFIHVRTMDVTDDAVRMTLEIIRRIDTQTEKHLQKELLQDIKRVTGKVQLLYRIAEAVVEEPDGTIRDGALSAGQGRRLSGSGGRSQGQWAPVPHLVSVCHAPEVRPPLSADAALGPGAPDLPERESLSAGHRGPGGHQAVPGDEGSVLPRRCPARRGRAAQLARHRDRRARWQRPQVNRQYYELCVLQRLERALKCKEVWVEGAYAFRNPSQDLPARIGRMRRSGTAYYQGSRNPWR